MPIFDTPPDTPEPAPRVVLWDQLDTPADQQIRRRTATAQLSDPRSPATFGVERTPIVATAEAAECDVHRDWSTG